MNEIEVVGNLLGREGEMDERIVREKKLPKLDGLILGFAELDEPECTTNSCFGCINHSCVVEAECRCDSR